MSIPVKSAPESDPPRKPRPVRSNEERAALEKQWREENAEAIAASNRYVEEHGLPLAKYRLF